MMGLNQLEPNPKGKHRIKRVGRGESSGLGKTSCRGFNGQNSRSGSKSRAIFEGGQTPLQRRLPKFGFKSLNMKVKKNTAVVNLRSLNVFPANSQVDLTVLKERGLVPKRAKKVRILAKGKLEHPLTIKAHYFSQTALDKISQAKGAAEVV